MTVFPRRLTFALMALTCLGGGAARAPGPVVAFPPSFAVDLHGPGQKLEHISVAFAEPVDFSRRRLRVTFQAPMTFVRRPFTAIQLWAKDSEWRWQNTTWTEGMLSSENPAFQDGVVTITYHPTAATISKQGWTQYGFDPASGIRELGIKIATPGAAALDYHLQGEVKVLRVDVERFTPPPSEPAVMRPLLRRETDRPNAPTRPLSVGDVKTGAGRYFVYGDFHRWDEAAQRIAGYFGAQQAHGLSGFRLLGALDTRTQRGGVQIGDRELAALEAYLAAARAADQRHHIITLVDAAVANDTLQQAMTDAAARSAFIDAFRPLLARFGRAEIAGEPVVFDLVNEIQNLNGVTERQRQVFVEAFLDAFIKEAPGASVTVSVYGQWDLVYWLYLAERYAGRPIRLLYTFHQYQPLDVLPAVWELNLPEEVEVGITEADARHGMETQLRLAAEKGYRWLLFWQDAEYPYDPTEHRAALDRLAAP